MSTRSEQTKETIIQAALTVISREGIGSLTMDAVAREAGLSKGECSTTFPVRMS